VVRTASPKIGILGNSTFARQNGTKKVDMEPTNTVTNQFKRVEVSICFSECFRTKWLKAMKCWLVLNQKPSS
jgi:hypothetical protein